MNLKIVKLSMWFLAVAGLLTVLGFVDSKQDGKNCESIIIDIEAGDGLFFVEPNDVLGLIKKEGLEITGKPLYALDFESLEELILTNNYVKEAQVYATVCGKLKIRIEQRKPVLRVLSSQNGDYYYDEDGEIMPVSNSYTANVILANGHVGLIPPANLKMLATFVNKNKFWKSQILQIYVDWTGSIQLIPRVGSHKIILGDCSDLEIKFNKLFAFYKDGLNKIGWNTYKTINLKYKNQVVCTKI